MKAWCILIQLFKAKTRFLWVNKLDKGCGSWNLGHLYTQRRPLAKNTNIKPIVLDKFIDRYDYVRGLTSGRNDVKLINYVITRLFLTINKYDILFCLFSHTHNPFDISAFWAYSRGVLPKRDTNLRADRHIVFSFYFRDFLFLMATIVTGPFIYPLYLCTFKNRQKSKK